MAEEQYFYYKDKSKKIIPDPDKNKHFLAKKILDEIFMTQKDLIPSIYKENWNRVKLYQPAGIVEKAQAILLNINDGAYDLRNKINNLTGKEWTKFTCSWFIFNALQSDLQEERAVTKETQAHPATFSPTMISDFINFFTKEGDIVLDPFAGIGSTLVACKRNNRY